MLVGVQEAAMSESIPLKDVNGGKINRFSLRTQTTVVKALDYRTITQECERDTLVTMVETLKTPTKEELKVCKIIDNLPSKKTGSINAELVLRKKAKSLRVK